MLEREITVFPALAHIVTKNINGHHAESSTGESATAVAVSCKEECSEEEAKRMTNGDDDCKDSDTEGAVSPLDRPRKIWKTCSDSGKPFKSEEDQAGKS